MSNKGKIFTAADAPRGMRSNPQKAEAWAAAQTARNKIVAFDRSERPDRQAISQEELDARALAKLSPKARRIAGMLLRCPPNVRTEVLSCFGKTGKLVFPFEMKKS